MTLEEMYELLKQKKKETNWNDKQSIRKYREYARKLQKMVEEEE